MAYAYNDNTDLEEALRANTQALQAQQGFLAQPQHQHQLNANAFGSVLSAGSSGLTDWATTTATGTTDSTLTVTNGSINGAQIEQMWTDDISQRQEACKKKAEPNWFRVNEEFPKNYGLDYKEEPLDDLRKEMAAWLEDK
jgi:hypothetical protein